MPTNSRAALRIRRARAAHRRADDDHPPRQAPQAYVDKVNAALEGTEWADKPIEEVVANLSSLPADKLGPVRNNGGGHYNHSLFWESLSPDGGEPEGELLDAINAKFGRSTPSRSSSRRRGQPVRLRLGVARPRRRRARDHEHAEPGLAADRRQGRRCSATMSGSTRTTSSTRTSARLPQGVLERRQLGEGRRAVRRRQVAPHRSGQPERFGTSGRPRRTSRAPRSFWQRRDAGGLDQPGGVRPRER